MKTLILILLAIIAIPITTTGQTNGFKWQFRNSKVDTVLSLQHISNPLFINSFKISICPQQFTINNEKIGKFPRLKPFPVETKENVFSGDSIIVENFPGSDRFYGKFTTKPEVEGKILVIKPDTTSKYYLIIGEPNLYTIIR